MKTFIRTHSKALDMICLAAVVLGYLGRGALPRPLLILLIIGGMIGLFVFTSLLLPKRPACPNCGFRDYSRYRKVDTGLYHCPRCGAILDNESAHK